MDALDMEQGSERWLGVRLGRPTGSMFKKIVTGTGKAVASIGRTTYMAELLNERLIGIDIIQEEHYVSEAMERGTELEPQARGWYEKKQDVKVDEVGFVYALDGRCGVSPDGLVSNRGGVEIKCPSSANHVKHLAAGAVPKDWIVQIHGCIWACNRKWWDFVCYNDNENIPSMVVRVMRDEVMCLAFDSYMPAFCDELDALEIRIRKEYGLQPRKDIELDKLNPVFMTEEMNIMAMEEMGVNEL